MPEHFFIRRQVAVLPCGPAGIIPYKSLREKLAKGMLRLALNMAEIEKRFRPAVRDTMADARCAAMRDFVRQLHRSLHQPGEKISRWGRVSTRGELGRKAKRGKRRKVRPKLYAIGES